MRGFKLDREATKLARSKFGYAAGALTVFLRNKRSFISQPKVTPHTNGAEPHLILARDAREKGPIRAEIFRRNREANGGLNRCWKCGVLVFEFIPLHYVRREKFGEWHHVHNKPGERCDCPENGAVSCAECHKEIHVQVEWSKAS